MITASAARASKAKGHASRGTRHARRVAARGAQRGRPGVHVGRISSNRTMISTRIAIREKPLYAGDLLIRATALDAWRSLIRKRSQVRVLDRPLRVVLADDVRRAEHAEMERQHRRRDVE